MFKQLSIALSALAAVAALVASPAVAAPVSVTDDMGRQIELPAPPQRIATTASFAVAYLMALDHPPVLRPALPSADDASAELDAIPELAVDHSVGPNLEQLAAASPDLVITTPMFAQFIPIIEQTLGVPVMVQQITGINDVPNTARVIGDLIGKTEAGDALAQQLREQIDAVAPPPVVPAPKVFALFGTPDAFFALLPDSYLGSMVEHLGGSLITQGMTPAGMSKQLAPFSLEILVAHNPDVILMVHHGPPGEKSSELQSRPAWSTLQAVRTGRVHALDEKLFMTNPGPDAPEALRHLRNLLYPEAKRDDQR